MGHVDRLNHFRSLIDFVNLSHLDHFEPPFGPFLVIFDKLTILKIPAILTILTILSRFQVWPIWTTLACLPLPKSKFFDLSHQPIKLKAFGNDYIA